MTNKEISNKEFAKEYYEAYIKYDSQLNTLYEVRHNLAINLTDKEAKVLSDIIDKVYMRKCYFKDKFRELCIDVIIDNEALIKEMLYGKEVC